MTRIGTRPQYATTAPVAFVLALLKDGALPSTTGLQSSRAVR